MKFVYPELKYLYLYMNSKFACDFKINGSDRFAINKTHIIMKI